MADPIQDVNWWYKKRAALWAAYLSPADETRFESRMERLKRQEDLAAQIALCDRMIAGMGGTVPNYGPNSNNPVRTTRVDMNDYA